MPASEVHVHPGTLTASVGPLHRNPTQAEIDSGWDFAGHQRGWKNAVDATMHDWSGVTARWRNQIKVQLAGLGDDANKLSALTVDTDLGAEILYTHMRRTAEAAARAQQREAESQGVKVPDWDLDNVTAALSGTGQLRAVASVTSNILGSSLVQSAKRHALRLFGVHEGSTLATDVDDEMADLSDAFPRENIGSSMTAAQNLGRLAVLDVILEPGVYLASEALDKNTCLAPEVGVTTRSGVVPASRVTMDHELLTHSGRWVRPSHITVSQVDEDLVQVHFARGVSLRMTWDHPVLTHRDKSFTWVNAGDLSVGDFVVDQSTFKIGSESRVIDLLFGESPDVVPPVNESCCLPAISIGPLRVPVVPISLDDESVADDEVHHPCADLDLCPVGIPQSFQAFPDTLFDTGLSVAGPVAACGAVASIDLPGWDYVKSGPAVIAGNSDGRASAGFAAVAAVLGLGMSESSSTTLARSVTSPGVLAACSGTVRVPRSIGHGDVEADVAVRADLRNSIGGRCDLGTKIGIGVLALDRAVNSAGPLPPLDLFSADLAQRRLPVRTSSNPSSFDRTALADRAELDRIAALSTRVIHDFSVQVEGLECVPVTSVERAPYQGEVFDFTVPGDETFWAEGILVHNCKNCIAVDGTEFSTLADAREAYPQGGYAQCQGGGRCRGTMITLWGRGETASAAPMEGITMPWHKVNHHSECTSAKPWAVVKDATGAVVGCHASEADADKQLAALYAAEGKAAVATAEEVITEETEELGGKPNPGTKKDKRVKENKYEDGTEELAAQDCPPGMEMDPKTGKCVKMQQAAALAPVTEPAADSKTAPWRGPLTVEGIETGDGREFDAGALTWPDNIQPGEVPLRWNRVDSHGGAPQTEAVNVGSITRIWREGSLVMGEGMLDLGDEDGQRVHDKIKGGFLRGVSVDVDSIKEADMELVWPDAPDGTGDGDMFDQLFAAPEKVIFHKGRIRAATIVDIPAFAEAYIALLDEEGAVIAGGEPIGSLRASRTPRAVFTGVALHASASGWTPPSAWFTNPDLSVPTGITVDGEGRVYGHAALWGTCHIGQEGVCVTPPREEDHPYFMTGEMICADDARVSVGQITVGTGHAPLSQNARAASDHYDNTGSAVADVVVGNDIHGIWVAGAVRSGADSGRVHELRAAGQVSGDWRRIGGQLRLVGLLAVNVPGFPVPKLKTRITAGSQFALVASGIPNLSEQVTEDELDQWAYRRVMGKLIDRVHRKG